jgi:protein-L-isoaspartate(D-aspartate) O-methyltransferase
LHEALSGSVTEVPAGLLAAGIAELADLDLWLTLAEPGLTRLNMMGRHEARASPAQQRIAGLMPLGGLAQVGGSGGLGVAALNSGGRGAHAGSFGIVVRGYGPGGADLAAYLARRAVGWDEAGRPGVERLELSAYPPGTPVEAMGRESIVIDRPHVRLAVRWLAS